MKNSDTQGTSQITAAKPENLSTLEELTSGIHTIHNHQDSGIHCYIINTLRQQRKKHLY